MEPNEARVYFALDGDDFDPDEVTRFLGIEPTSVSRKGNQAFGGFPKTDSWIISTGNIVNDQVDVFEKSTEIVYRLKHKKDLIIKAKSIFGVSPRLEVVLWFSTNEEHSTPAIGFEVETVSFLGEIGASTDIDTYKH